MIEYGWIGLLLITSGWAQIELPPRQESENSTSDSILDDLENAQSPSYNIMIVLSSSRVRETNEVLEERINEFLMEAERAALSKKYNMPRELETERPPIPQRLTAKITNRVLNEANTILSFQTFLDGSRVPAKAVIEDISLLSTQYISSVLRHPVSRVLTDDILVKENTASWWVIGLIVAVGVLLLLAGWCCLFCYFNTCGRLQFNAQKDEQQEQEAIREDAPDRAPIVAAPPLRPVRRPTRRRPAQHVDVGVATDERKESEEAVRPYTGQPEETAVLDSSFTAPSVVDRRQATTRDALQPQPLSFDNLNGIEEKRDGDDWDDEEEEDKQGKTALDIRRVTRPMTAGTKRPVRTIDGRVIARQDPEWTPYTAGDRVNAIYAIRPPSSYDQPVPIERTENGVVEYSTKIDMTPVSRFL